MSYHRISVLVVCSFVIAIAIVVATNLGSEKPAPQQPAFTEAPPSTGLDTLILVDGEGWSNSLPELKQLLEEDGKLGGTVKLVQTWTIAPNRDLDFLPTWRAVTSIVTEHRFVFHVGSVLIHESKKDPVADWNARKDAVFESWRQAIWSLERSDVLLGTEPEIVRLTVDGVEATREEMILCKAAIHGLPGKVQLLESRISTAHFKSGQYMRARSTMVLGRHGFTSFIVFEEPAEEAEYVLDDEYRQIDREATLVKSWRAARERSVIHQ